MTLPDGGFDGDGNYVVNPKSRPQVTIYGSFSADELGFLTKEEQAVARNCPAGYASLAAIARSLVAAREESGAFETIRADIEAYIAAANAADTGIAPPQNSPTDFVIN